MSVSKSQTIRVYCLASFSDDEADEILTQLEDDSYHSYSAADARVELIPWTQDRDGGKEDIFRLFFENRDAEAEFMFFIDRRSLDLQDFLVADVRSVRRAAPETFSPAQWFLTEPNQNDYTPSPLQDSPGLRIVIARCKRNSGWYGNSYSGIKTTFIGLVSGRITLNDLVHRSTSPSGQSNEKRRVSHALDMCDEAYSASARAMRIQANLLSCEAQARSTGGECGERKPPLLSSQQSCCSAYCPSSTRILRV